MNFFIPLFLSLFLHFAFFLLLSQKEITEPIYEEVQKAKKINLKLNSPNQTFENSPQIQKNRDKLDTKPPLIPSKSKEENKTPPNILENEKIKKEVLQPLSKENIKESTKENTKELSKENLKKDAKKDTQEDIKKDIKETSPKVQEKLSPNDSITNSYLELYKDDFETFPQETKIYLLKNIKDIGKITQRYLIYPHISVRAKQSGINIVEFVLYPDGKITTPKILKSSKYYILDDNSIETIERAYRDYPLPDKATIIRIYVKYELL